MILLYRKRQFNMPNTTMELFIFGDQTLDVQPCLRGLAQHRHNPVLEDFFTKTYQVLRTEIDQLPHNVKVGLPRFTCIDDIIFRPPGSKSCIALDMAMTTFYQLGVFIRYVSDCNPLTPLFCWN